MRAFGTLRIATVFAILFLSLAACMPNKEQIKEDYPDDEYDEDAAAGADDDESTMPQVEPRPAAGPIHVRSRPIDVLARPGDTVELPCLVDNAEDTVINWLKDNELLFTDDTPMDDFAGRLVRAQNFSLILKNVTEKDASDHYRCQILVKPMVEIVHKLHVGEKPRELWNGIHVTPGRRVEITENESVTLGCTVNMEPKPEIKWSHKGERLHNGEVMQAGGSSITIKKATRHHAGRYQCLVEDGSEKLPHDSIDVVVRYAPVIDVEHEIVHTGAGIKSELTCIVHAHPHAEISWHKNNKLITEKKDRKYFVEDKSRRTLVIAHTTLHDLGQYTCVAKNKLGEASRTIELSGAPSQPRYRGAEIADDEKSIVLQWVVESYSPILEYKMQYRPKGEMKWITLSPAVTNGNGNQFTAKQALSGLQPGSYEARLTAKNDYGWSPHSDIHHFDEEYKSKDAETVKYESSSAETRPLLALTAILIIAVSSFESTYL